MDSNIHTSVTAPIDMVGRSIPLPTSEAIITISFTCVLQWTGRYIIDISIDFTRTHT